MHAQHALTDRYIDCRLDKRVFAERVVVGDESAVLDEQREATRGVAGRDEHAFVAVGGARAGRDVDLGVGLRIACRALTIFSSIAKAAGENLNNDTFSVSLENLGEVPLPGTGVGTLGDGKYDALDDLRLWTLNPNAEADGQDFIEFG